jgi:hypothetical protein
MLLGVHSSAFAQVNCNDNPELCCTFNDDCDLFEVCVYLEDGSPTTVT